MKKDRLIKITIVAFKLPTEYKGSLKDIVASDGAIQEIRIFEPEKLNRYRTLRRLFYTQLHRVAYPTDIGWVLFTDISPQDAQRLDDIIARLNELAGTQRIVKLIDAYLPRETVSAWITQYIQAIQEKIREEEKKMQETQDIKKKQRHRNKLRQLQKLLATLQAQLEKL